MKKTVLITGGGRGIGAATARLLAQQGHAICINYASNQASAQVVVNDIHAAAGARAGGGAKGARHFAIHGPRQRQINHP